MSQHVGSVGSAGRLDFVCMADLFHKQRIVSVQCCPGDLADELGHPHKSGGIMYAHPGKECPT